MKSQIKKKKHSPNVKTRTEPTSTSHMSQREPSPSSQSTTNLFPHTIHHSIPKVHPGIPRLSATGSERHSTFGRRSQRAHAPNLTGNQRPALVRALLSMRGVGTPACPGAPCIQDALSPCFWFPPNHSEAKDKLESIFQCQASKHSSQFRSESPGQELCSWHSHYC